MSLTCGFFNAIDHDRLYSAEDFSRFFDGVITDGVFEDFGDKFVVTATGQGLNAAVGTGRAWFDGTWSYNDAKYVLTLDAAESALSRIDAIVLEINHTLTVRANSFKIVKGTPASSPVRPTLTDTDDVKQYALCYITLTKGQTTLTDASIQNVIGLEETPFVTSILQQTDVQYLYDAWDSAYQEWLAGVKSTWTSFYSSAGSDWTSFKTAKDSDWTSFKTAKDSDYSSWKAAKEADVQQLLEDTQEMVEDAEALIDESTAASLITKVTEAETKADSAKTAADAATAALSERDYELTFTLPASGWSSGAQTVTVTGVTASMSGIFAVQTGLTDTQYEAAVNAQLYLSAQAANSVTIKAFGDTPEIDIPCVILVNKK